MKNSQILLKCVFCVYSILIGFLINRRRCEFTFDFLFRFIFKRIFLQNWGGLHVAHYHTTSLQGPAIALQSAAPGSCLRMGWDGWGGMGWIDG